MTGSTLNTSPGSGPQQAAGTLPVSRAILYATLTVAILDACDGMIFRALHGQNPIQMMQFIASSVLGARAFSGGLGSALVGLLLHLFISLAVAAIYILASRRIALLRTQCVLLGPIYGAGVWIVMNLVVLPHTSIVHGHPSTAAVLNGIIAHAFLVGLPSAFFAKKSPVA